MKERGIDAQHFIGAAKSLYGSQGARSPRSRLPHFHPQLFVPARLFRKKGVAMHLKDKIKQTGAAGYILLWLLGIPLPILLLIFLLRGCT